MNTAIMKSLLEEYLGELSITSDLLAEVEHYIFNDRNFRHIHPSEITDTALYLKEIAQENGCATSQELSYFLHNKKKKYNKFLWNLIEEEGSENYSDTSLENNLPDLPFLPLNNLIYPDLNGYNVQSYIKTLSSYFKYIFQSFKNDMLEYQVTTILLDACSSDNPLVNSLAIDSNMNRKFARYFEEFSTKDENKKVIAWAYTQGNDDIPSRGTWRECNSDIENHLFLKAKKECYFQEGSKSVYDNIVAHISQEQPISDESIKVEMANWLFCSKMHTAESEPFHFAPEPMRDPKTNPELSGIPAESFHAVNLWRANCQTMLTQKQWRILKSPPGHAWLASDNPGFGISLQDLYTRPTEMIADGNLTDIRPDTIIYYPISSDYCLRIQPFTGSKETHMISAKSAIEYEQSTLEELEVVNGLTFTTKKQIVIGRDKKSFEQLVSI